MSKGKSVKGTRYNNAGWAALNTSDDTVAVNKPTTEISNITQNRIISAIHWQLWTCGSCAKLKSADRT